MATKKINISQKQLFIVAAIIIVAIALFVVIRANVREKSNAERIAITAWGTEPRGVFDDLFQAYTNTLRPNVTISYEQINPDAYQATLLSALAAGEGPDIFMLGNRELTLRKSLIAPVNPEQFTLGQFRAAFPTAAEQDFVDGNAIFALPLYLDTIALIYNKNSFDQAGIPHAPATWTEFQELIPRLRLLNAQGQIVKAGAGIGGSEATIEYAVDIINLLMLQSGTEIVRENKQSANFAKRGGSGLQAFEFYLQFANAGSPFYTWNDTRPKALESFITGNVGMAFAYQKDLRALSKRNPFLDFGVAPAPQVDPQHAVTYPRYEGFSVSKQSAVPEWAWDFIIFATTQPGGLSAYLKKTGSPSALRSLIPEQLKDPDLGVFASQTLTARSWYMKDQKRATDIFNEAIKNVISGKLNAEAALREAEEGITRLLR